MVVIDVDTKKTLAELKEVPRTENVLLVGNKLISFDGRELLVQKLTNKRE